MSPSWRDERIFFLLCYTAPSSFAQMAKGLKRVNGGREEKLESNTVRQCHGCL